MARTFNIASSYRVEREAMRRNRQGARVRSSVWQSAVGGGGVGEGVGGRGPGERRSGEETWGME